MRTTININNELKEKLKVMSERLEISTNDLIEMLINIIISKNHLDIAAFKAVRYQGIDPYKKWCKFHVTFNPQVYEQGLDLRKCLKLSVSFIISFAIVHFLDELAEKLSNSKNINEMVDNYPFNYIFMAKDYSGIKGYLVLWGIPEEKHLKKLIK